MGVSDYILVHPFKKGLNVLKCDCVDDFKSFRPDRRKSLQDELKAAALDEARPAWLELGLRFNQIPKNQRSLDRFGSAGYCVLQLLLLLYFFCLFFLLVFFVSWLLHATARVLKRPTCPILLRRTIWTGWQLHWLVFHSFQG